MAGGNGGASGVGKGRRMPVQQSVDIGIPIETVYNQFTQFEDWPQFMHRVKRATQDDDCTVSFAVKIWGRTREFTAEIETQRPDQRIKWKTSQGMTHAGVVTFHELGPNLTRMIVNFDVDPGGLIEKFARGARHVKRAVRGDLHRFVAFIEMAELESGAWRGVIEEGELVEEHDPGYDEQREYADANNLVEASDEADDDEEDGDREDADEEEPKAQRSRRPRQSRNGSQEDERDEDPATRRARTQSRASSSGRASRSRGSSGGRTGSSGRSSSSGGRTRSPRGSGSAQASGRRTRSAS